ncbi:hypothetical protein RYX36_033534, partial [Vicia faba]
QTKVVYKYELPKKKPTCKTVKKKVRFVDSEPTILGEENNEEVEKRRCNSNDGLVEKEGIRVTIRLTKQQAVELLSKCNGSVLELKDVSQQTKVVYKYELPKKKPTCKTVKKKVRFVDSEPTILGEENNEEVEKRRCNSNDGLVEKEGIRVTIRLTKQQAVELLSKCNGSVVELKDVA